MKKVSKNLPKTICVLIVCAAILTCTFMVIKNATQNPINKTLNIARNMLSTGDTYCITIKDGENILSETLVYGNKKTKQYKIQQENFSNYNVEYPFVMVINGDEININHSKMAYCNVRNGYSYVATKAYSNDAFVDTRNERGFYLISKPNEKQLLMLNSINNAISGFVNKEDISTFVFDFLYSTNTFKPDIENNDALPDTFRAGVDDLKSWVKNEAIDEVIKYEKESVPGGYKISFNISKETQLKALSFFKPLFGYIDMHGGDDLTEEYIKYSLVNLDISITVVDNKITQIEYTDLDTSNTIKITVSEHEEFNPYIITYKSYVTEMDLENSSTIYGYEKDIETRIIENAKLVSDSDICDVNFLTFYESKSTNETMALMSIRNKTDKKIQFSANNIIYNNMLNSNINSTYSEYNDTYYLSFVIPEEYCKNSEVIISFDLVCNYIDSEESVVVPISFTANTEIENNI